MPINVVKQKYGAEVRRSVLDEAIKESLTEAIKEQELQIAGMPDIEVTQVDQDKGLEYIANF